MPENGLACIPNVAPLTAAAIPPGLFKTTQLARLWRDGCPIAEAELSSLDGFAEFQQREAAREAMPLAQLSGSTRAVMVFVSRSLLKLSSRDRFPFAWPPRTENQ